MLIAYPLVSSRPELGSSASLDGRNICISLSASSFVFDHLAQSERHDDADTELPVVSDSKLARESTATILPCDGAETYRSDCVITACGTVNITIAVIGFAQLEDATAWTSVTTKSLQESVCDAAGGVFINEPASCWLM